MDIGNNAATALKSYVEAIVELEEDKIRAGDTRKDLLKEMKRAKLPVAELLKVANYTPLDSTKLVKLSMASAILGRAFPLEETIGEVILDAELADLAKEKISIIQSIDIEIDGYKEKIKEVYAEVKETGFTPSIVKKVVEFQLDQTKQEAYNESSLLLDKYLEALT